MVPSFLPHGVEQSHFEVESLAVERSCSDDRKYSKSPLTPADFSTLYDDTVIYPNSILILRR